VLRYVSIQGCNSVFRLFVSGKFEKMIVNSGFKSLLAVRAASGTGHTPECVSDKTSRSTLVEKCSAVV